MADAGAPRTRLEQVLHQRHWSVAEFMRQYIRVTGEDLSERQAYRWISGGLRGLPHPRARGALEKLCGEPAARLLGPPYGVGVARPTTRQAETAATSVRGSSRTDWEGQVITMSADRARDFLARAEVSNVGPETLDQLVDDVRRLAIAHQQEPLERILNEMADTQDRAFSLLEGRQRPDQSRDLYLMAGIMSGLMAQASLDLAAPHDAMIQARAAYACADNAGHDGLRAWTRGIQALITYWSGRFADAVRYAELGIEVAGRNYGTAVVWLASSKARALAAQGGMDRAQTAIEQAAAARDLVQPNDLDELGGLCTFARPRQLYYAADALAWGGMEYANRAERVATETIDTFATAQAHDRSYGAEFCVRADLAIARIHRRDIEGAAEALAPVLALPTAQRIHGIVTSVDYVGRVLQATIDKETSPVVIELQGAIENFTTERLALPR